MRRGFKAEAERLSAQARAELELGANAPLSPWAYARHLGVVVLDFDNLDLAALHRRRLLVEDPESWSGMTLKEGGITAILVNPSHVQQRQCSTLMHELAHHLLRHVPAQVNVSETGLMLLSDYSDEQEAEANWLAGALLAPRNALMQMRGHGLGVDRIATKFCISEQMVEWRLRMTGIDVQLRRARR